MKIIVPLSLVLWASTAAAQVEKAMPDQATLESKDDAVSDEPCRELYNPDAALRKSAIPTAIGTGVGLGLMGIGAAVPGFLFVGFITTIIVLDVGPSTGHFYADNNLQAWLNMGLRFVFSAASVYGMVNWFLWALGTAECESNPTVQCSDSYKFQKKFWPALTISAGIATVGLAVFDILTAPRAARRANKKSCDKSKVKAFLAPGPIYTSQGKTGAGLWLTAVF